MVASISSGSNVSKWADSVFSKLDTKNQGYIEKTDLQDALSKVSGNGKGSGGAVDVDDTFSALDGDSNGKVTKSELTDAMTKLSDQLNAQFDASRVGRGGPHGGGGRVGGSEGEDTSTDGTSSTSTDYVAAADTDGDGTVSDAEQAAYDKKVASEKTDSGDGGDSGKASGPEKAGHQKDPLRELAHALHLLKAYADNGGSDGSAASTGDASSTGGSVSVEA